MSEPVLDHGACPECGTSLECDGIDVYCTNCDYYFDLDPEDLEDE